MFINRTSCFISAYVIANLVLKSISSDSMIHHSPVLFDFTNFFTGVSYHFVKMYGHPVGWQIVYYIFTFLKGIMFFSVIMLVGTGWSLLKVSIVVVLFFAGCGFSFSSSLFLLLRLFFS